MTQIEFPPACLFSEGQGGAAGLSELCNSRKLVPNRLPSPSTFSKGLMVFSRGIQSRRSSRKVIASGQKNKVDIFWQDPKVWFSQEGCNIEEAEQVVIISITYIWAFSITRITMEFLPPPPLLGETYTNCKHFQVALINISITSFTAVARLFKTYKTQPHPPAEIRTREAEESLASLSQLSLSQFFKCCQKYSTVVLNSNTEVLKQQGVAVCFGEKGGCTATPQRKSVGKTKGN